MADADWTGRACDCHMHFYDARWPTAPGARVVADHWIGDYAAVQAVIGTRRVVVVQPSTYGTDNRCTLAAMAAIGETARGVAVVNDRVGDAELRDLHAQGIRGIRFNLVTTGANPVSTEMIVPLAHRIAELGWHIQFYIAVDHTVALRDTLTSLPVPVVFDHFGRLSIGSDGRGEHPAFGIIAGMLEAGRAWVKLSGPYNFIDGDDYGATVPLAHRLIAIAPDQLVWGSDWPHPARAAGKPALDVLVRLRDAWIGDPNLRRKILADNPARLYDFPTSDTGA